MPIPDRSTFENAYAGIPPWEIGKPQPVFVNAADRMLGSVLDAGCGTGETSLFLAQRGHQVTGIDFLKAPIERARVKALERNCVATFLEMDALEVQTLSETFDTVIDSGLFHVFSDVDRERYVSAISAVTNPGGRLFLLCFSDQEPGEHGPRRVSRSELESSFSEGWEIESLDPVRLEVRPDLKEFTPGGPHAWFLVARRSS